MARVRPTFWKKQIDKLVQSENIPVVFKQYLNFGTTGGETGYGFRDNSGTVQFKNDAGVWTDIGTGGTGGGHTIQDEGTPLTQRTNLNFVGAGVAVTDDAGNDATVVTITSGGGGSGDVVGPASAVDGTPSVFDGTTGKLIKNITYAAFKSLLSLVKSDVGLGNVDNTSDANKPVSTATQTALNLKEDTANKNVAGGYAGLDGGGKVPTSQLPALALTDVFTVASQVAQLALTAEEGDVAIRTDLNKSYIHNGGVAGTMADWSELLTPTDTVLSVNGETGAVTITTDDISDSGQTNKWSTAAEKTKLGHISVTQAVDLDAIESASHAAATVTDSTSIDLILTGQDISAQREALTGAITAPKNSNTTSLGSFTVAQLNVAISDGDVATGGGTATGTNTGDQTITLTGEVTGTGTGSFATTLLNSAVIGKLLTGLSLVSGAAVTATDSILVAIGKLQKQNTDQDTAIALNTAKVTNATHTGDATGATTLTLATVNSNTGSFGLAGSVAQFTVNAKGLITAAANVAISITSSAVTDFAATVRSTVLTGLSVATGTAVTAADTILVAIGKLQKQNTDQDTAIALNTAKVTNATHTGEVTGSGALTVDKTAITNKTLVTAAVGDHVLIADASDTDNLKKVTVQTIIDLAGAGGTVFNDIFIDQSGGTSDTYGVLTGTINGSNALFTVSQSVYATGTLKVWLNGQLMTQGSAEDFVETTPASGTFTFNTAPETGSLITVEYQKVVTNSNTVVTTADYQDAVVRVVHGATAGTTRPTGATYVEWVGSVEPTNATNNDTWVVTT